MTGPAAAAAVEVAVVHDDHHQRRGGQHPQREAGPPDRPREPGQRPTTPDPARPRAGFPGRTLRFVFLVDGPGFRGPGGFPGAGGCPVAGWSSRVTRPVGVTISRCTCPPGVVTRARMGRPLPRACAAAAAMISRCGSSPVTAVVTPPTVTVGGSARFASTTGHFGVVASSFAAAVGCHAGHPPPVLGAAPAPASQELICVGARWISKCMGSCTPRKSPPHSMPQRAAMSCAAGGITNRPDRP